MHVPCVSKKKITKTAGTVMMLCMNCGVTVNYLGHHSTAQCVIDLPCLEQQAPCTVIYFFEFCK